MKPILALIAAAIGISNRKTEWKTELIKLIDWTSISSVKIQTDAIWCLRTMSNERIITCFWSLKNDHYQEMVGTQWESLMNLSYGTQKF